MKTGLFDPDYRQRILSLRFGTTVLLMAAAAKVVWKYFEFRNTWGEVQPAGYYKLLLFPIVIDSAGVWPVVLTTASVIAAIIYVWSAKRVLPVILATVCAATLCALVGWVFHTAKMDAWKHNQSLAPITGSRTGTIR